MDEPSNVGHLRGEMMTKKWMGSVTALMCWLAAGSLFAGERNQEGFYRTGAGVRVKEVAFFEAKVYAIEHFIRELPRARSKSEVIESEVDKKFSWRMLRDVEREKIQDALRGAYELNSYGDKQKIELALSAFDADLVEGARVAITFDAAKKMTQFRVGNGKSVGVPGIDFMRATWRIWFGKIDQPALSDSLLSEIPVATTATTH